jgi:hypothetical protein
MYRHLSEIFGREVLSSGQLLASLRVSGAGAIAALHPDVTYNTLDDEYLVVWQDSRERGPTFRGVDIYAQRLARDSGQLRRGGVDVLVSGPRMTWMDEQAAVAYNATSHEYLVVWRDGAIRAQRVSAAGVRVGPTMRLAGAAGDTWEPSIAVVFNTFPPRQEFLVTWTDDRFVDVEGRGEDIFAQRLTPYGSRIGRHQRISGPAATGHDFQSAVAPNPTPSVVVVVWRDGRGPDFARIWGQLVGGDSPLP